MSGNPDGCFTFLRHSDAASSNQEPPTSNACKTVIFYFRVHCVRSIFSFFETLQIALSGVNGVQVVLLPRVAALTSDKVFYCRKRKRAMRTAICIPRHGADYQSANCQRSVATDLIHAVSCRSPPLQVKFLPYVFLT